MRLDKRHGTKTHNISVYLFDEKKNTKVVFVLFTLEAAYLNTKG